VSSGTNLVRRPLSWPLPRPLARPGDRSSSSTARSSLEGERQGLRWWREALVVGLLYAAYDFTRGLQGAGVSTADANGRRWLHWEQDWHLAPEHALNHLLGQVPVLAGIAAYFYATLHFVITPTVLIWLYRSHSDRYRQARSAIVLATAIALAGFWLLPTAPPRLLPGGHFLDTLSDVSGWGWWGSEGSTPRGLGSLSNQLAAMPSLHVGWALWSGWLIAQQARRRWVRILGILYPVLTTLVVVATGNHYLLDAVAGALVVIASFAVVALLAPREPPRPLVGRAAQRPQCSGNPPADRLDVDAQRSVPRSGPRYGCNGVNRSTSTVRSSATVGSRHAADSRRPRGRRPTVAP
jgi:PAP2 superfamily